MSDRQPGKATQGRARQGRAGQDKAGQGRARQVAACAQGPVVESAIAASSSPEIGLTIEAVATA
jgi:hypothetical protein